MSGVPGKVVAITGASSGIGEATALELAARGATVVLGARRIDRLRALAERIRASGGRAEVLSVDVTRRADLEQLVAKAVERFDRLDVFVSNAGIARTGLVGDLDVDSWNAMIDVNLRGVLHGPRPRRVPALIPHSSGWRAIPAGARPAKSQPTIAANAGMPSRMSRRSATGMFASAAIPPFSELLRSQPIIAM
jgi:NADP-dependent 3-hydroxy acid dehydrogenase YdfG